MSAVFERASGLLASVSVLMLRLFVLFTVTAVAYFVTTVLYNIFLHPLRRFPGPKFWAASRIPYATTKAKGRAPRKILELHSQYGDIVRVAPNELSFQHADAWKDVYGHRQAGQSENGKDPLFFAEAANNIVGANRENHSRFRSALSHGFSAKAMADQQPLVKGYIDLLIRRLQENSTSGQPLDMVSWYNWTTFDIIGDLAFGESFGCLEKSKMHPWIAVIFDSVKASALVSEALRFPFMSVLLQWMIPREWQRKRAMRDELTAANVKKRMELGTSRSDFIEAMLSKKGEKALTPGEMASNADVLIIAGSETTATTLSAVTYYLGCNPYVMDKLVAEVRSSFSSEDEINIHSVQNLSYMLAVLDETMRMYPPIPSALPRRAPDGGTDVAGQWIPGHTTLGVWQWTLYHNPNNFLMPESFIPERWLEDPRFANDKREILQPFSFGPRNCIGRNLAYTEMRLILARIIWNFDLRLADDCKDWLEEHKMYALWEKTPLYVCLTPRKME